MRDIPRKSCIRRSLRTNRSRPPRTTGFSANVLTNKITKFEDVFFKVSNFIRVKYET